MKLSKTGKVQPITIDCYGEEVEMIIRHITGHEFDKLSAKYPEFASGESQVALLTASITAWPFEDEETGKAWPIDTEHVGYLAPAIRFQILEEVTQAMSPPDPKSNSAS